MYSRVTTATPDKAFSANVVERSRLANGELAAVVVVVLASGSVKRRPTSCTRESKGPNGSGNAYHGRMRSGACGRNQNRSRASTTRSSLAPIRFRL